MTGLVINMNAFTFKIISGWQLRSIDKNINYDVKNKKWKAYIPNKNINLNKFGIEDLTKINKYDGFWINALTNFTLKINENNISNNNSSSNSILIPIDPLKQYTLFPRHYPSMRVNPSVFAVLRSDGKVITWGYDKWGGDSSNVANELHNVKAIYSTNCALAALRKDGSVVTWGDELNGGDNSKVINELHNIVGFSPSYTKFLNQ
jgi:hypothetical protein